MAGPSRCGESGSGSERAWQLECDEQRVACAPVQGAPLAFGISSPAQSCGPPDGPGDQLAGVGVTLELECCAVLPRTGTAHRRNGRRSPEDLLLHLLHMAPHATATTPSGGSEGRYDGVGFHQAAMRLGVLTKREDPSWSPGAGIAFTGTASTLSARCEVMLSQESPVAPSHISRWRSTTRRLAIDGHRVLEVIIGCPDAVNLVTECDRCMRCAPRRISGGALVGEAAGIK